MAVTGPGGSFQSAFWAAIAWYRNTLASSSVVRPAAPLLSISLAASSSAFSASAKRFCSTASLPVFSRSLACAAGAPGTSTTSTGPSRWRATAAANRRCASSPWGRSGTAAKIGWMLLTVGVWANASDVVARLANSGIHPIRPGAACLAVCRMAGRLRRPLSGRYCTMTM